MKLAARLLGHPRLFRAVGAVGRSVLRRLPSRLARMAAGAWGRTRELPPPPTESFRAWYRANRADGPAQS
jgi:L-lactate dehydrogenase complex protein LldF